MRYRPLSASGDYTIGQAFLADSPQCVAQAVQTRLELWLGEWFMDTSDGTPWPSVLGKINGKNPDAYIKQRILSTPGVTGLVSYSGTFTGNARAYSVTATINTLYGQSTVSATSG